MGIDKVLELSDVSFSVIERSRIVGYRVTRHRYREGMTCGILDNKIKRICQME